MRSEQELRQAIERYGAAVRRVCLVHLKSEEDTKDIFQEVFLKYATCSTAFASAGHEKAWLIRVSRNACRDVLRSAFRRRSVPLEELVETAAPAEHREVLEAVLSLPQPYREAVYLHYYEGYTAEEIGRLLGRSTNTVYTHLTRARQQLRRILGGEDGA